MAYPSSAYSLQEGYPEIKDYLHLRVVSGLSPRTASQAGEVSKGSWYGCYVTCTESNKVVGMGRIIGDGGWYFHIADMAVHPDHQRKGLGDMILKKLLATITERAPKDGKPYINLFADEPGRRLYYKNGFADAAPKELGMWMEQPAAN